MLLLSALRSSPSDLAWLRMRRGAHRGRGLRIRAVNIEENRLDALVTREISAVGEATMDLLRVRGRDDQHGHQNS